MAKIRFENVKKGFNDVVVVKDLSLTINNGEFFTFVGPSGCGKSTLLNMIAGLEPVAEGKIYFDDLLVNDLSPKERDVAMVFQSYALYPHMTVYENMAFPLQMKKEEKDIVDNEVKKAAAMLGLEELLKRRPKELSGGQRQRVALGRALIRKPKVFLMDEPLSNLDARLRIEMRAELKRLHQELKITTVYVTHDQAEAMSLSERIAVINQGEIQQCGTSLDVYQRPANIFVAGFIGSPPMNFIKCRVESKKPLKIACNNITLFPESKNKPQADAVMMGIRPEDISVSNKRTKDSIEILISVIEPAGSFNWVDMLWNDISIKGKAEVDLALKAGQKAFARFSMDKVIVFNDISGRRL